MKRAIVVLIATVILLVTFTAVDLSANNIETVSTETTVASTAETEATTASETVAPTTVTEKSEKNTAKKSIGSSEESDEKVVYLTFDDGPSAVTPEIIDVLDKYNVKATFFVTGANQEYSDYIKTEYEKGHTVGLHTYSHEYSQLYSSVDAYYEDLNKISDLVERQTGVKTKYIRFPGGSSNTISANYCVGIMTTLTEDVQAKGYQYYDWNCMNGDAEGNNIPVDTLVENAKQGNGLQNIVMLCHDGIGKESTAEALPKIIEYYQSQGYTFKGIDDNSFTAHHGVNN